MGNHIDSIAELAAGQSWSPGPITASRLRRTQGLYTLIFVLGAIPLFLNASPSWKAAGLGLWIPGGGFLAYGVWGILLLAVTFALFLAAVFAWFAAGAILAPILIWGGTAVLAAAFARSPFWSPAPYLAAASCAALTALLYRRASKRHSQQTASATQRAAILPKALTDARVRALSQPPFSERELNDSELSGIRYMLDRALQPIDRFDGFDCIDKFQTASLRYQVNFLGYGLSQLQQLYLPNFHGYLSQAQRNAIDKYLCRHVWDYWVYESCWGHLNFTDWNPAAKDNIMLTGYYGAQVALYCANTGDACYAVPGSLTFRLNRRKAWPHDVHSIVSSVYENFQKSAYCLYPCEPNWIYSGCNFRGMTTLAAHDRAFGTNYVASIRDRWLAQLDREFTNRAGGIVGLRSSLTGIEFPFPSSELSYCLTANTFAPERAERMWALVQFGMRRLLGEQDGRPVIKLPNAGIDFGNYRRGSLGFAMGALLAAAREFGDAELADAALNTLDLRCGRTEQEGVVHYRCASNLANLYICASRFGRRNDYRDVFTSKPSSAALTGPILSDAKYPDVLVARAVSDGEDLDLVLVPGGPAAEPASIGISRLVPGRVYAVTGKAELSAIADSRGEITFSVPLRERSRIHIAPRA